MPKLVARNARRPFEMFFCRAYRHHLDNVRQGGHGQSWLRAILFVAIYIMHASFFANTRSHPVSAVSPIRGRANITSLKSRMRIIVDLARPVPSPWTQFEGYVLSPPRDSRASREMTSGHRYREKAPSRGRAVLSETGFANIWSSAPSSRGQSRSSSRAFTRNVPLRQL